MRLSNILALVATLALGAFLFSQLGPERVITVVEYETVQIDENLWVSKANYATQRQMLDKLRSDSTQIANELQRTGRALRDQTQIIANLRLQRDSLLSAPTIIVLDESRLDTVLTYMYGDSLLAVSAIISLDSLQFSHDVEINQLRPIELRTITTQDDTGVYFYVESRDLEIMEINSFVAIDKPKYKWYHYVGAGFVSGVLIWELIR